MAAAIRRDFENFLASLLFGTVMFLKEHPSFFMLSVCSSKEGSWGGILSSPRPLGALSKLLTVASLVQNRNGFLRVLSHAVKVKIWNLV